VTSILATVNIRVRDKLLMETLNGINGSTCVCCYRTCV